MGTSQSVYMANDSSQDIYVAVALNLKWAIVDFFVDISLMLVAVGELKRVTMLAELPETLKTFYDLYKFLKIAITIMSGTVSAGTRPGEAALALVNAFKKNSVRIPSGDYKKVEENGFLSIYLNADGIASLLGAENVSLMVLSGDGKQLAIWNTDSDKSWIATNEQKIVRSKYGSIWQQDPGAGTQNWPISSA